MRHGALQTKVPARRADVDSERPGRDNPPLRNDIPDRHVVTCQLHGHGLGLTGREVDGPRTTALGRREENAERVQRTEVRQLVRRGNCAAKANGVRNGLNGR